MEQLRAELEEERQARKDAEAEIDDLEARLGSAKDMLEEANDEIEGLKRGRGEDDEDADVTVDGTGPNSDRKRRRVELERHAQDLEQVSALTTSLQPWNVS